jgi:hypothetical protein
MGRIAEVQITRRVADADGHGLDVQCDPGGGANVTAPVFGPAGTDAVPLPGDFVALEDSVGAGAEHATGFADVGLAGRAQPGEVRLYARRTDGSLAIELWLKADGTLVIGSGGDVTINGVTITASGAIRAPGEVTAMASSPASSVSLSTHYHGSNTGPTTKPLPGT